MPATVIGAFRVCFAVLILAAIGFGLGYGAAAEDRVSGDRESILVIDGDTLEVAGRIIQLAGIDAPEIGQVCVHGDQDWHCGLRAAYALHKFIELAADPVICSRLTPTADGVLSGICEAGDENLALTMLRGGYATVPPKAGFFYRETAENARDAGLGLWASRFVLPWEWREGKRLPEEAHWTDRACQILGTITPAGEKLYYVPTDSQFHEIREDGDVVREFCSDEDARAAGWHRPGEVKDGS